MNTNSNTRTIHTYRYTNDAAVRTLEVAISKVLEHTLDTTGRLPFVLFVPPKQITEAQRIIDMVRREFEKIGRPAEILVTSVGGCLVGEIWWTDGQQ